MNITNSNLQHFSVYFSRFYDVFEGHWGTIYISLSLHSARFEFGSLARRITIQTKCLRTPWDQVLENPSQQNWVNHWNFVIEALYCTTLGCIKPYQVVNKLRSFPISSGARVMNQQQYDIPMETHGILLDALMAMALSNSGPSCLGYLESLWDPKWATWTKPLWHPVESWLINDVILISWRMKWYL